MSRVLVIGNGPAAHRFVERLRHHGFTGDVTVLGAENHPAYNRVLLCSVLEQTLPAEAVLFPTPPDVEVHLGVRAVHIDRHRKVVRTDDGTLHRYDELVLATGARPRIPSIPGLRDADGTLAPGVTALRSLTDCERLAEQVGDTGRVAVLGGGVLGVEVAQGLAARADVTLVHPQTHPMDRQLDVDGARILVDHLRQSGIELRLRRGAAEYRSRTLVLDDAESLRVDALVVCTGVEPNTDLAMTAGVTVRRGIVVDSRMRTDVAHVHAIGDCAEHAGEVPGLIATAWEQAEVLATQLAEVEPRGRYQPPKPLTRLKARGIDLASVGTLDVFSSLDADVEVVMLADPTRGRYAKLALHRDQVRGAVLLGFPRAIATISRLHDEGRLVPADRLSLLLGTPTGTGAPVELADDAVLCRCNNVTKKALATAWHSGARSIPALANATRATTGCGGCADEIRALCRTFTTTTETAELSEQEGAA